MTFEHTIGTRAQVWHGTAKKTSGGLTKTHLMMNKHGRIVSRKKHASAKKEKRLVKAGFLTKKGHFGFVKHGSKKMRGGTGAPMGNSPGGPLGNAMSGTATPLPHVSPMTIAKGLPTGGNMMMKKGGKRHHSRKMRGGCHVNQPLSPSPYDGQGVGTSGVALQFIAGQGN